MIRKILKWGLLGIIATSALATVQTCSESEYWASEKKDIVKEADKVFWASSLKPNIVKEVQTYYLPGVDTTYSVVKKGLLRDITYIVTIQDANHR